MIRFLEKNYRKMEEIIRVLSISDKWMTKKELAKYIGSSESTFIRYIEEIKQRWGESLTIKTSQRPPNCSMSLSKILAKPSNIIAIPSILVALLLLEN